MTTENELACRCGAPQRIVDIFGSSATLFCTKCEHFSLGITREESRHGIFLVNFHVKRGDGPDQRPLHDLEMATQLVACLFDDVRPSEAIIAEYGIDTARHMYALRHAVRCGCTAYDLDRVMGDGRAITHLVDCAAGQP